MFRFIRVQRYTLMLPDKPFGLCTQTETEKYSPTSRALC